MSTKKDLVGIDWLVVNGKGPLYNEFNPANPDETIYRPLGGALATAFDITREEFEFAAALDIEATGFFSDITVSAPAFSPNNYDLVGSLSAEGYAKEGSNAGYAKSFFTDEVEGFRGLIIVTETPKDVAAANAVGADEAELYFSRRHQH